MKVADCPPVRAELELGSEQVEHFFRSRRSIRTYSPKEMEREKLSRLISIAQYAPSGTNSQQVQWLSKP
ncbi:MAG: nitroreductase family protein [Desulfuromonadaceae bacterium]